MEKIYNLLKGTRKKSIAVLSLLVCVVIVVAGLPITLNTNAAEIPSFVACEDNFDRADSDTVGNGWITYPDSSYFAIKDNKLEIKVADASRNARRLQRPMSEAAINQTVSITYSMADKAAQKWPVLWLRVQNENNSTPIGYYCYILNTNLYIYKSTSSGAGKLLEQIYNPDPSVYESIVLKFSAISNSNGATTLKVDCSGTKPDGTTGASLSVSVGDSTAELQNAGTVAVSGLETSSTGNDLTIAFDDFKYSYADLKYNTTYIDEDFDRENSSEINNGWETYPDSSYFAIKDNKLEIKVADASRNARRLQRPMSEAALNQKISVTISMSEKSELKWPVLWLRVQNDTSSIPAGYYCYILNSQIHIYKSTSNGAQNLFSGWYDPSASVYESLTLTFSATSNNNITTLNINCYATKSDGTVGAPFSNNVSDNTAELQNAGTVAISGFETGSSTNPAMLLDDFSYTVTTDATPLYELVEEAEEIVKAGIGYTEESFKAIEREIEEAIAVINKGSAATQAELNEAFSELNAELENSIKLPEISEIKINGKGIDKVSYNSYNATVEKDVTNLEFDVIPKDTTDTVVVTSEKTGIANLTQEFTADFCESYAVTVASATNENVRSVFYVSVYRNGGIFEEFTDSFEHTDGAVGNGWIEETDNILGMRDGNLNITCDGVTGSNNLYTHRVIRPYNEKTVEQSVVVDIPIETFKNRCIPRIWLRLQEDDDTDPLNNEGYYVNINVYDGVQIGKRYNKNGTMVDERLNGASYLPNLNLYEGVLRFEITLREMETTEIRVRIKSNIPTSGGEAWRFNLDAKDTEQSIKEAGTVGISYTASISDCGISYFSYEPYVLPDYMIHAIGKATNGYFCQWLDLDPSATYVYSYDIYCANDLAKTSVMPTLQYSSASSRSCNYFYFTEYNRDYKNKTFTGEFKAPADALKQIDGKVSVRVGFYTGGQGSDAYLHNLTVYKKDDPSKTNLIENYDFSKGLYGWQTTGTDRFSTIISESMLASSSGDIELEEYKSELFKPDSQANNDKPYDNYKGDYMWFQNGIVAWSEFGQFVKLIPGETYMYTYHYNYIANNWSQPDLKHYWGDTGNWSSIRPNYKIQDPKNCLITVEFTVPKNTVLNPDGKTTDVRVGVNSGHLGSTVYYYRPTLYLKSDKNKTNLFYNSDFKRGLEGWVYNGSGTENVVSIPDVFVAPIKGEIELMPVELAYFGLGDLKGDGEWWREFYPNGLPWDTQEESEEPEAEDTNTDDDFTIDFTDDEEEPTEESDTDIATDSTDNNNDTPKKNTGSKPDNDTDVNIWLIVGIAASVVIAAAALAVIILVLKKKKK